MPRDTKKPKTWKDLDIATSEKKPKSSFYAKVKRFFLYLKYAFTLALLICIGIACYILYKTERIEDYLHNDSQKIKNFIFEKDKNITAKWVYDYSGIKPATALDAIDIFEIKERLEHIKQIDSVKIEKVYPDSLKVSIEEKDYIAKTYNNGKLLIISSKGDFYEPICISQEELLKLIELSELNIETKDNNYIAFDKAAKLKDFLEQAKIFEGIEYDSWQRINMKKAYYLVEPMMEIHTMNNMKIIFSFENYKEEFIKLKATLEFSKRNAVKFSEIDLALKDRADVKLKK